VHNRAYQFKGRSGNGAAFPHSEAPISALRYIAGGISAVAIVILATAAMMALFVALVYAGLWALILVWPG
jgi:hypothetical protein